jgi:hypothetical protein
MYKRIYLTCFVYDFMTPGRRYNKYILTNVRTVAKYIYCFMCSKPQYSREVNN